VGKQLPTTPITEAKGFGDSNKRGKEKLALFVFCNRLTAAS